MASRGRRYDNEPKLNMKKVFAVILAFIVVIMFIFIIKGILDKGEEQGVITGKSYFAAYKNNKWGVIDEKGNEVIDPSYGEIITIPNAKNDVFLCVYDVDYDNGTYKTKALDSKGKEIFTDYEQIEAVQGLTKSGEINYSEEALKVMKNGKYGAIDFTGKVILPCEYSQIETIAEMQNMLKIAKDGKVGLVKTNGTKVLEPKYEDVVNVSEGNKYVVIQDGKQVLVKDDGTELLSEGFDKITSILKNEDDGVIYQKGNNYGVMKLSGDITIKPEYEDLKEAKTGTLIAKKNGKYGIIDFQENTKLDFKYSSISYENKADIYITENESYENEILNSSYELKQSGILTDIDSERGYIALRKDGEYKYYNFRFEEKSESDIFPTTTLFLSKKDGKYGFIDKNGNVVVDYQYDDATNQNTYGYAGIKKDGKWGVVNSKGEIIQEPTYNLDDYLQVNFIGRWHFGKDLNMNYYNQL